MSEYSDHPFDVSSQNNSWTNLYSYIKEGARVLDVGCSSGKFGEALKELKNCEVIGIDIDKKDINIASKVLDKALVMDVGSNEIFKLGKFDVIIFADVLEHLQDPRSILKNIKKILKKEGIVVFSLPHMAHVSVRLDLLEGNFPYKNKGLLDRTHLHFYDKDEAEGIFFEAGYEIPAMNPVISGYPKRQISERLKKTGLENNDKFMAFLDKTNANIFQFVGMAKPTKNTKFKKEVKYVMPQDEVKSYAETILSENRRLWKESERLKEENTNLKQELGNNRIIKFTNNIKRPISRIKNTINKGNKRQR